MGDAFFADRIFEVLAHLGDSRKSVCAVEILLNEVIGEFGVGVFRDVVDFGYEKSVLAREVGIVRIRYGERDLDIHGFAGHMTDELLEKIVDVGGDTDRDIGSVSAGRAVLEFDAVDRSHIVDVHRIAVGYGAVGAL